MCQEKFQKKLDNDSNAAERFHLNKLLIDFENIPHDLVIGFKEKYGLTN